MGVHGLWNLIEPAGKVVPLETLENKVLAVDVSIWLHQVVKGFQDTRGNPLPNAHLLGLFHRICKLLFYKIRPVFVFDGGVPHLKKQTVAARQQKKNKAETDAECLRERILTNLIKHKAVNNALGNSDGNNATRIQKHTDRDDMFRLPTLSEHDQEEENRSEAEDSVTSDDEDSPSKHVPRDLHSVDVTSEQFKALPADVRHEILTDLRETRKQSSWGRLHEMPKDSGDFSSFQMGRLLKRRSVQVSLEQAEKEMGGHTLSLREMEEMLREQGVNTSLNVGSRIASDNVTRFIYIKDTGNNGKVAEEGSRKTLPTVKESVESASYQLSKSDDSDNDIQTVTEKTVVYESNWVSDDEFDEDMIEDDEMTRLAKNFMFENSGLTQKQILKIIQDQIRKKKANKSLDCSNSQPTTSKSLPPENKLLHGEGTSANSSNSIPCEAENKLTNCETMKSSETSDTIVPVTDVLQENDVDSLLKTEHKNGHESITCKTETKSTVNEDIDSQDTSVEKATTDRTVSQQICSDDSEKSLEEVSIKETELTEERTIELQSSDSEVDFVEVNSSANSAQKESDMKAKPLLEVVIKKDASNLDDDIFADIFTKNPDLSEGKQNKCDAPVYNASNENLLPVKDNENCNDHSFSLPQKSDLKNNNVAVTSKESIINKTDFVDVNSSANGAQKESDMKAKTVIEVVIKKDDCNLDDDIFADIFTKTPDLNISSSHNTEHHAAVPYSDVVTAPEASKDSTVTQAMNVRHEEVIEDFVATEELKTERKVQDAAITTEKLQTMRNMLEQEQRVLFSERGRQERLAASITEQMNVEAQELLQLFGIPYIVAPMEAEAQCAFLDTISLTDGTITDDSDIWLFGGQNVYKNFFNQKKHVLQFKAAEIQRYFRLTRRQLIVLALLVGSDYTTGLSGIGPVTALEIISAFPCGNEDSVEAITRGLRKFREWLITGKAAGPGGRAALRNKLKDIKLSEGFPNTAVVEAYVFPEIDHSKETFTWSTPDVSALRNYAREKFGWTQMRTDEILLPVLKRLGDRNVQKTIENYFKSKPILSRPVEAKLSKRVQKAVDRIDKGEAGSESEEEPRPKRKQTFEKRARVNSKKKKSVNEGTTVTEQPGMSSEGICGVDESVKIIASQKSAPVRRVRKTNVHPYKQSGEFILQREKAKIDSLKTKLKAIEIYRTSKMENKKKSVRTKPKELKEANLSESSSDE